MHIVLKSGIEDNTNHNTHVISMEHALSRDWMLRIRTLIDMRFDGSALLISQATNSLQWLLVGHEIFQLDRVDADMCYLQV